MTTLTLCLMRRGALGEGQRIPRAPQVVRVVKNLPANSGDTREVGLIPKLGRSSGVGNGTPLQYSCLENSMGRWPWWATVHGGHRRSDTIEHKQQQRTPKDAR